MVDLDFTNSGSGYKQSPFKKRGSKCPICGGKTGWNCDVTEDEGLAYCSKVPSDNTDKKGRYQHILKTGQQETVSTVTVQDEKIIESHKADSDRLNDVYTALLNGLNLSAEHRENLENRGLD